MYKLLHLWYMGHDFNHSKRSLGVLNYPCHKCHWMFHILEIIKLHMKSNPNTKKNNLKDYVGQHYFYLLSVWINITAKNAFEGASCIDVICVNYHSSKTWLWESINSSRKSFEISSLSALFLFVVYVNNNYIKQHIW